MQRITQPVNYVKKKTKVPKSMPQRKLNPIEKKKSKKGFDEDQGIGYRSINSIDAIKKGGELTEEQKKKIDFLMRDTDKKAAIIHVLAYDKDLIERYIDGKLKEREKNIKELSRGGEYSKLTDLYLNLPYPRTRSLPDLSTDILEKMVSELERRRKEGEVIELLLYIGKKHDKKHEFNESEKVYKKVMELDKENSTAYNKLTQVLVIQNKIKEALNLVLSQTSKPTDIKLTQPKINEIVELVSLAQKIEKRENMKQITELKDRLPSQDTEKPQAKKIMSSLEERLVNQVKDLMAKEKELTREKTHNRQVLVRSEIKKVLKPIPFAKPKLNGILDLVHRAQWLENKMDNQLIAELRYEILLQGAEIPKQAKIVPRPEDKIVPHTLEREDIETLKRITKLFLELSF